MKRDLLIIGSSHPDHILAVRAAKFVKDKHPETIDRAHGVLIEFENGASFWVWQNERRQTVKQISEGTP